MDTQPVIQRLLTALNQHDLDAFVDCFDPGYQSEQPVHPGRVFTGSQQVRKNWSALFSSTPDFSAEILRAVFEGEAHWAEWRWSGSRTDGTKFEMRGVTIQGIRNDRIIWGRLYMEEVETASAGIDVTVQNLTHQPAPES